MKRSRKINLFYNNTTGMKKLVLIPLLLMCCTGWAQKQPATTQFINPAGLAVPKGYSHVAKIDVGNSWMLIISGQVALDSSGMLIGKDNLVQQTEQVFKNIQTAVIQCGGTMEHIVKLGYFMLDVKQVQEVREVRNKFINVQQPPASTLVQVNKLFREDILIEVEATAVIPKK
jgi:2-iminobutanoate/2-iminopropanoate deaminase